MRAILVTLTLLVLPLAASAEPVQVVAFGDSLTAGYGLDPGESYPEKLESALEADGLDVDIQNAGVSGDTSTAAAQRLGWAVPDGTDAVIVALGGNDLLRGIDPDVTRKALTAIVDDLTGRGISVLLAGMRAPANLGDDYVTRFEAIFADLGARDGVILMPFFLDGVATDARLNQSDGIHPNEAGVKVIVGNIQPFAVQLIEQVEKSG
ncbi:arylesterase [Tepidamorphus sp. 3E244]|uniref:arylesterase n=1 Tax=Tepidamorphus sp. 3E244 TaxID=3385498 RepID=UPI0038FC6168